MKVKKAIVKMYFIERLNKLFFLSANKQKGKSKKAKGKSKKAKGKSK